jgi:hypothetical protein
MPAVYKEKSSPYYQTDIWIDGNKFHRSTRKTSEREAKAEAGRLEQKLRDELKVRSVAAASLRIDDVAFRYMTDVGDHHAGEGASITEGKVARLVKYFGPDKLMTDITHDDVVQLVNWRRKQKVGKGKNAKPISPFTVNDTTEQLCSPISRFGRSCCRITRRTSANPRCGSKNRSPDPVPYRRASTPGSPTPWTSGPTPSR